MQDYETVWILGDPQNFIRRRIQGFGVMVVLPCPFLARKLPKNLGVTIYKSMPVGCLFANVLSRISTCVSTWHLHYTCPTVLFHQKSDLLSWKSQRKVLGNKELEEGGSSKICHVPACLVKPHQDSELLAQLNQTRLSTK